MNKQEQWSEFLERLGRVLPNADCRKALSATNSPMNLENGFRYGVYNLDKTNVLATLQQEGRPLALLTRQGTPPHNFLNLALVFQDEELESLRERVAEIKQTIESSRVAAGETTKRRGKGASGANNVRVYFHDNGVYLWQHQGEPSSVDPSDKSFGNTLAPTKVLFSDVMCDAERNPVDVAYLDRLKQLLGKTPFQQLLPLGGYFPTPGPKVLISYSHDSEAHRQNVLALADRLRDDGVDCNIDQYDPSPLQGWPRWMMDEIEASEFVLVVCTETYNQRFRGKTPKGTGKGVKWEGAIITQELYDNELYNAKFIPVVLSPDDSVHIPMTLRAVTFYDCGTDSGYEDLLRRLTSQPFTPKPALGNTPTLAPQVRTKGKSGDDAIPEQLRLAQEHAKQLIRDGADADHINDAKREIIRIRREVRDGEKLHPRDLLLGRYELIECIGSGGFATVWKCLDERTMSVVAAKILHPSHREERTRVERFFRGARLMKQMAHENIVRVLEEECIEDGKNFYIMEFVDGKNFHSAVLSDRLTNEAVIEIVLVAAEALHYAHTAVDGLVHRDVKPSNILLTTDGHVRVSDFDLVRTLDTTGGTRTGALGTFIYTAPECLDKPSDVDPRADVFSLGMTTVFGLYGRELPRRTFAQPAEFIDTLRCSTRIKDVLKRAVPWEPPDRFSSMREFADALQAYSK